MDSIRVSGIEFWARHGALESERQQGQRFGVDVSFCLDSSLCGDVLSRTVHYGDLALEIVSFCQKQTYQLLETLINELAEHLLLTFPLMESLTLCLHKPNAPIPLHFSDVSIQITRCWTVCYLGIGSNLGERERYLQSVLAAIERDKCFSFLAQSQLRETEPYGVTDQPRFLNAVLQVKTLYTPARLLEACQRWEKEAGRVKTRPWGERTLDVDILFYGQESLERAGLCIPHPDLQRRRFVLEPLCELAPQLVHPLLKRTMRTLLLDLDREENAANMEIRHEL